ncbi:MAG: RNaseH domain-containing protein [Cyanobacteria bacterium P01_G01_bin.39]
MNKTHENAAEIQKMPTNPEDIQESTNILIFILLTQDKLYKLAVPPLKKYIALGNAKTTDTIPLAFTVPDNLTSVVVDGFTLAWTKEALANFSQVHEDVKQIKNLPYASLRGFLEIGLSNISRIVPGMELSSYAVSQRKSKPFAYINGGNEDEIKQVLKPLLNDWIVKHLVPYGEREGISEDAIERLRELQNSDKLLLIRPFEAQIFPWGWDEASGTTSPPDKYKSFPQFADYIARLISDQEIFQRLGKMKRIITKGQIGSGIVELLTEPIQLKNKDLFSLCVLLELVTFPSIHQPLLTMNVTKRRWLSKLNDSGFSPNGINGYIFSKNHKDRVFNFKLNRCKNKVTDKYEWQPDSSFPVLQRKLKLPLDKFTGAQIARGEVSKNGCQVLLTYSDSDPNQSHNIKAGVPEKDKLEAFKAIEEIFRTQNIIPFDGYTSVKAKHPTKDKNDTDAATKQINKPTLLNAVVELLENPQLKDFTSKYLNNKSDSEINKLLKKHFNFRLSEQGIKVFRFNNKNKDQSGELRTLIKLNKEAVKRLYPKEKPLVIIFHENKDSYSLKLLTTILKILWGDTIEIQPSAIPENTHGAKTQLPHSDLKNKERSQKRVEEWIHTANQIAKIKRPKFCLVMASKFYTDPSNPDKQLPDDPVNKPSTCKAIASIGRSCVQFIVPPSPFPDTGDISISKFVFPAQSAIKELLWAHFGRIDKVQEKVDRYFEDIELENRPKEVIAITIVRRNAGRKRGRLENTFLPIAIRTNVATGLNEMKCCYEHPKTKKFVIIPWKPFTEALHDISDISPLSLGKDKSNKYLRHERFQTFVDKVISDSVEENKNPVVMIDSSNCAYLWGWLSDRKMNLSNIDIFSEDKKKECMQNNRKGATLVRIRQDLAPGIIEDKVKYLAKTALADTRTKKELKADKDKQIKISAPSSPTGLFKLNVENKTGCVPYLSIGKKTLHTNQRGASCYREVEQDKFSTFKKTDENDKTTYPRSTNEAELEIKTLQKQEPHTDQWATPNPLEIVVALRPKKSKSDNIAAFIESLRYQGNRIKIFNQNMPELDKI